MVISQSPIASCRRPSGFFLQPVGPLNGETSSIYSVYAWSCSVEKEIVAAQTAFEQSESAIGVAANRPGTPCRLRTDCPALKSVEQRCHAAIPRACSGVPHSEVLSRRIAIVLGSSHRPVMNRQTGYGQTIVLRRSQEGDGWLMRFSWLVERDALSVVLILAVTMLVAAEIAYLVACRWRSTTNTSARDNFVALRVSLLGLLSLLLGFSFAMASGRYETRRELVVEEATVLRTLFMRSSFLSEPERSEFRDLLRQYVQGRAASQILNRDLSSKKIEIFVARSDSLHRKMWDLVSELAVKEPATPAAADMVTCLIDAANLQMKRVQAYTSRVPDPVLWLLFGASVAALIAVGYSEGLYKKRELLARTLFSLVVCGTIFVVLEIDRPERGMIKVNQEPMIRLKELISDDVAGEQKQTDE